MDLSFTLEEMETLYGQANAYAGQFEAAINNLDSAVRELGSLWTSEETGTYEAFKNLYNEKKKTLVDALEYMKKFCAKIEEKRADFSAASNTVKNTFE